MTTGSDHVFACSGPIERKVARFLDAWAIRWPGMTVEVEGAGEPRPWAAGRVEDLNETAEIYLVRDRDMDDHWERFGYSLDESLEGPLRLAYRPFPTGVFPVVALEDPYGRNDPSFEPYDLRVVGAGLYLVTVVLPEGEGSFGADVLAALEGALSVEV